MTILLAIGLAATNEGETNMGAEINAYEQVLAAEGMPAELPPCGDEPLETTAEIPCFCHAVGEVLEAGGFSVESFLQAAARDPESLTAWIESMSGLNH